MNQTPQEHPPETVSKAASEISKVDGAKHRVRADLKAYLDGELSGPRHWLTARHIAGCASCRVEMHGLEQLSRQVRTLDQAAPDARLRARILASLPAAPPSASPSAPRLQITSGGSYRLPSRRPLYALAGLCALLLMVGAFALPHFARPGGAIHAHVNAPGGFAINTPTSVKPYTGLNTAARNPVSVTPDSNSNSNTSNADSASPTEPNPSPAYTDPTSAQADRLAATLISDKLREKHQLATANPAPANTEKPGQPAANVTAPAPTQVVIAVANVVEARRQVKKWADQAGAQMTVLAYTAAGGKPFDNKAFDTPISKATGAASHDPEPARAETGGTEASLPVTTPAAQPPALLRLKVPAQHADSLRTCLARVGTPVAVTPNWTGRELQMVRPLGMEDLVPHPNAAVALPAFAPKTTSAGERPATVTIVLRLQPGSAVPR